MPVRALLDTHSFIWFIGGDPRLSSDARDTIEAKENTILVSVASLWEIAIKQSIGKLTLSRSFADLVPEQLAKQDIEVLGIELAHLAALAALPLHHRDPFDRLIIAQALTEGLPVIGVDGIFDSYGVSRIW